MTNDKLDRSARQARVFEWVVDTFGQAVAQPVERAARVLEEALELAQAAGIRKEDAYRLLDHVYAKPPGEVRQEAGGVGVTLLAFCEASKFDADTAENMEFERARRQPRDKMRARHQAKVDVGVAAPMSEPSPTQGYNITSIRRVLEVACSGRFTSPTDRMLAEVLGLVVLELEHLRERSAQATPAGVEERLAAGERGFPHDGGGERGAGSPAPVTRAAGYPRV